MKASSSVVRAVSYDKCVGLADFGKAFASAERKHDSNMASAREWLKKHGIDTSKDRNLVPQEKRDLIVSGIRADIVAHRAPLVIGCLEAGGKQLWFNVAKNDLPPSDKARLAKVTHYEVSAKDVVLAARADYKDAGNLAMYEAVKIEKVAIQDWARQIYGRLFDTVLAKQAEQKKATRAKKATETVADKALDRLQKMIDWIEEQKEPNFDKKGLADALRAILVNKALLTPTIINPSK